MSGEGPTAGKARKGRPKALRPHVVRDGFAWPTGGLSARLYKHLYEQVPPGQRRGQMMRYMLLGFMAEKGIRPRETDFVPPALLEVDVGVRGTNGGSGSSGDGPAVVPPSGRAAPHGAAAGRADGVKAVPPGGGPGSSGSSPQTTEAASFEGAGSGAATGHGPDARSRPPARRVKASIFSQFKG